MRDMCESNSHVFDFNCTPAQIAPIRCFAIVGVVVAAAAVLVIQLKSMIFRYLSLSFLSYLGPVAVLMLFLRI